jgi:hypothetical protein
VIVVLGITALIILGSWLLPAIQAIRIPTQAWEELGQVKGIWVAITLWLPLLGGLAFLTIIRPKLIVAWRNVYDAESEEREAA